MSSSPSDSVSPAPAATPEEIRRLVGTTTDDRLAAIIATGASLAEVELACAYARGLGDVPGKDGHPLDGRAAAVFDIISADDELLEREP